ncbi:hypothetical protein [Mycoplasma sp. ATU-Cv-508]|uniref:hypothetical protein n=1 Tax=Mycoplasma sp. ATU-Cv-508 TaxID=2048001 RepID=UPI0013751A25
MLKFFLKRLLLAAFALLAITVIVYFLMSLTNSSPIDPLAYDSTADYEAALASAGLDKPVGTRFFDLRSRYFYWARVWQNLQRRWSWIDSSFIFRAAPLHALDNRPGVFAGDIFWLFARGFGWL